VQNKTIEKGRAFKSIHQLINKDEIN